MPVRQSVKRVIVLDNIEYTGDNMDELLEFSFDYSGELFLEIPLKAGEPMREIRLSDMQVGDVLAKNYGQDFDYRIFPASCFNKLYKDYTA